MKFKVGDKVVPISKTSPKWAGLESSVNWRRAKESGQNFLYVNELPGEIENFEMCYACGYTPLHQGDFFTESDLILYKEDNQMKKSDLKNGMWVVDRQGRWLQVLLNTEHGDILSGYGWINLSYINEDLTCTSTKNCDIMKVYKPTAEAYYNCKGYRDNDSGKTLIWERKEVKEISKDEVFRILKDKFGCDVKITE